MNIIIIFYYFNSATTKQTCDPHIYFWLRHTLFLPLPPLLPLSGLTRIDS